MNRGGDTFIFKPKLLIEGDFLILASKYDAFSSFYLGFLYEPLHEPACQSLVLVLRMCDHSKYHLPFSLLITEVRVIVHFVLQVLFLGYRTIDE